MVGLFKRKAKDWREDDYIFLEDLKKDPFEDEEVPEVKEEPKKEQFADLDRVETVKERLERIHEEDRNRSDVRQRLENLQHMKTPTPMPLNDRFLNNNVVSEEKKVELPDNKLLKKVENAIKKVESIKGKMENSNSYLSLFYDLKNAEKEFLAALGEAETEMIDFPEHLKTKIEKIKSKIRLAK